MLISQLTVDCICMKPNAIQAPCRKPGPAKPTAYHGRHEY